MKRGILYTNIQNIQREASNVYDLKHQNYPDSGYPEYHVRLMDINVYW